MLGFDDFSKMAQAIGIPSTVVMLALGAFHLGYIPSMTSSTHEKVDKLQFRMDQHESETNQIIRQHAEQMRILNRALKEICFNTSKDEYRTRKCAELDGSLSEKQ